MALNRYNKEYKMKERSFDRKKLNVVICIYHSSNLREKSPINEMLEKLQMQLKTECKKYDEIQIAYVYETPSLDAKGFQVFTEETPIYYKELYEKRCSYNLENVWFLGLALLEQKVMEQNLPADAEIENRIYLVTDERFDFYQSGKIVFEEDGEIKLHPRFSKLDITSVLIKTKSAGGELLEKYMSRVHIFKTWEEDENGNQYIL